LEKLVLVGGWVPYLYVHYLWKTPAADFPLTTDIDLGVRETGPLRPSSTVFQRLREAGLAMKRLHPKEAMPVKFIHRNGRSSVPIDFITSDTVSDDTRNRFLGGELAWSRITAFELLLEGTVPVEVGLGGKAFRVHVPSPSRFFFHKGIIFSSRNGEFKRAKDLYTFFWGVRFHPDRKSLLREILSFRDHEFFDYFRDNMLGHLQDVSQPGYLWLRPFLAAWLPEKEMNRAVEETMAPLIKELER
jgi:hypothetical protein